jgi:hypothetical protein
MTHTGGASQKRDISGTDRNKKASVPHIRTQLTYDGAQPPPRPHLIVQYGNGSYLGFVYSLDSLGYHDRITYMNGCAIFGEEFIEVANENINVDRF